MNSLEFIENQIKEIDKQLDYYKRKINEDCIFKSFIDNYTKTIKDLTNLKNTFLQIKTELEAWEIVKKDFILTWEEPNNASGYYLNYFGDCEYEKIKKALEVL